MATNWLNRIYLCLFGAAAIMALIISYIAMHRHTYPQVTKAQYFNNNFYLGQGWAQDQRQKFSYISFGSRIVPYNWFLFLEQAESANLFREASHMARLGFIQEAASVYNPDGLPIGFSRDTREQSEDNQDWVGLTCAACHTGEINIHGQTVRIDGGPALIDLVGFEQQLLTALKATLEQAEKWQRFSERITAQNKKQSLEKLKADLEKRVHYFEQRLAMNATSVPYGFGRLDAFGLVFNKVTAEVLRLPENRRSPNAPTSYPFLWNASHLNQVHWNASAPNAEPGPLFQNITTALAAYGDVQVESNDQTYGSSVKFENLGFIQASLYGLRAPKWPKNLAGDLNSELIITGEKIYRTECESCHHLVNSTAPDYKLNTLGVSIETLGTDPLMAKNFSEGQVKTGSLQGKKAFIFSGEPMSAEATRLDVTMHVVAGAVLNRPLDSLGAIVEEFQFQNKFPSSANKNVYKASPLAGIWATAPYLHNGSVPSLYDLLLPPEQRPVQFYVGNRELEAVKVGYVSELTEATTLFDTQLLGNSNAGHLYGTQLDEKDRMALLEYLKSL